MRVGVTGLRNTFVQHYKPQGSPAVFHPFSAKASLDLPAGLCSVGNTESDGLLFGQMVVSERSPFFVRDYIQDQPREASRDARV